MGFYDNFIKICKERGITAGAVCEKCGLSSSTHSKWKKSVPKSDTLIKIADTLNISVDSLLGREKSLLSNAEFVDESNIFLLPLYESVSAGLGRDAISEPVGFYPTVVEMPYDIESYFCVKVVGDSMYPKIEDNSIIVVRKQPCVENNKIAVVLIDREEALVKKIFKGKDYIELISINPLYPPIRFEKEEMNRVTIEGYVEEVITKCKS